MLLVFLALNAAVQPASGETQKTISITLEKLRSLRDDLLRDRATDKDLAEQETLMVATLEDLQFALGEAQRSSRLIERRLDDSEQLIDELDEQREALEKATKRSKSHTRTALGLLLRGNHSGADKPLLRAYQRQRMQRAFALWRATQAKDQELVNALDKGRRQRAAQQDLRADLKRLLGEREKVRSLAQKRLLELRRDRKRARAHAAALEEQRLALAAWLAQVKPLLEAPQRGLKRGALLPPVAGKVQNGYGWQEAADHLTRWRNRGLDLQGVAAAPVVAAAAGRVAFIGRSPSLGLTLVLDHGRGWRTVYGGLSEAKAQVEQDLSAGTVLGLIGDSGLLHFELRSEALTVNPTHWFHKPLAFASP
jgi:murein DD-endopeptidase MepM/ murein hydrolase activator NlpD